MPVFGVICEYDPFHLGHRWMLEQLHRQGPVVCAMSGCFTQRGAPALPAIALTAYATADDRVRALLAGFQVHVPKPVEPGELARAIAELARGAEKGSK